MDANNGVELIVLVSMLLKTSCQLILSTHEVNKDLG